MSTLVFLALQFTHPIQPVLPLLQLHARVLVLIGVARSSFLSFIWLMRRLAKLAW